MSLLASGAWGQVMTLIGEVTFFVILGMLLFAVALVGAAPPAVTPPPVNGSFDYQIGGAYPPAPAVAIVDRDRSEAPVPGRYNVCYLHGFQAQPGAARWWKARHGDLLLRRGGRYVVDTGWNEILLDTSTAAKRTALIAIVGEEMAHSVGIAAKIFAALAAAGVNMRLINQGASELNIIVGVAPEDYPGAVRAIYAAFVSQDE